MPCTSWMYSILSCRKLFFNMFFLLLKKKVSFDGRASRPPGLPTSRPTARSAACVFLRFMIQHMDPADWRSDGITHRSSCSQPHGASVTDACADCTPSPPVLPRLPSFVLVCRVRGARGGGARRSINVSGGSLECVTVRGAGKPPEVRAFN